MPGIKIFPPNQLPVRNLSQQQLEQWIVQLEIWLGQDNDMARFMEGGIYQNWQADEVLTNRLQDVVDADPKVVEGMTVNQRTELLEERRRQLRTFLSQTANCVSNEHHATIMRHSTSLQWIYDRIRQDYDIETKGVHFLNIIDIKYDAT